MQLTLYSHHGEFRGRRIQLRLLPCSRLKSTEGLMDRITSHHE